MTTVHRVIEAVRTAPRRTTTRAGLAALASLLAYAVLRHLSHVSMVDAVVYQAEGAAVVHGHDLYELRVGAYALPATDPPFSAMLFAPAAMLPFGLLRIAVTLVNLVELAVVAALSCKLVGRPARPLRPAAVLLVTGFAVWLEPVWTTLRYGQINLLILALVLWDLTLPEHSRLKGVGIGLAAGLKVTPGFFVLYLLLTRRFRAAATAAASCAGTVLVGLLVLPGASWSFWTKDLYDTTRVGKEYIVDNQSLRGMMDRLLLSTHTGISTLALAALVAVAGLALAVLIDRRCAGMPRARAWSGLTVAFTMVLVSPISWTHHWVWCVPLLVLLAAEARDEQRRARAGRRGHRWRLVFAATALCFCSFAMWFVPHKAWVGVQMSPWFEPAASVYPLFGLAFLALVAVRVRRRLRTPAAPLPQAPDTSAGRGASASGGRPRASARH